MSGGQGAPAPDLGRLIKLLELLRSDQPGEVVAAATAVVRFLDAHALGWDALLMPPEVLPVSVEVGGGAQAAGAAAAAQAAAAQMLNAYAAHGLGGLGARTWRQAARECLDAHVKAGGVLRVRDVDFVQGLLAKGWATLTPKQSAWLLDVCTRCGVPGW